MQTAVVQQAVHGFPVLLLCFQHGSYMKANVVSCLYCISPSPHLKPCKTGNESKVIKRGFKDDNTVKLQIAPKYLSKTFLEIMQTPAQLSTQHSCYPQTGQLCPSSSHALPPFTPAHYFPVFPAFLLKLPSCCREAFLPLLQVSKVKPLPAMTQKACEGSRNSTELCRPWTSLVSQSGANALPIHISTSRNASLARKKTHLLPAKSPSLNSQLLFIFFCFQR